MPVAPACLVFLLALWALPVSAEPVYRSAAGDRVEVHSAPALGCGARDCPPVQLCLGNPAGNATAKGLSNHAAAEPDLVARPGQAVCRDMTNVLQTITLWSSRGGTALVPVMVTPLDLRAKLGQVVHLRWSVEAHSSRGY